jgi:hypothetical protein
MRGPKLAAAAILAFFGGSVLAIHLMYLPEASAPRAPASAAEVPRGAPAVATALPLAPAAPVVPAVPALPKAPTPPSAEEIPGLPNLGVTRDLPAPTASGAREQMLNDCIERNLRGRGYGELKPTAPGRRLARAREQRRLLRLQARTACERELAG